MAMNTFVRQANVANYALGIFSILNIQVQSRPQAMWGQGVNRGHLEGAGDIGKEVCQITQLRLLDDHDQQNRTVMFSFIWA